jgi:hypothetical protein
MLSKKAYNLLDAILKAGILDIKKAINRLTLAGRG